MAELMEDTLLLQNDSSESRVQVKKIQIKHINEFPTELLSKVLGYLPQKDLVRNRGVCKHWRDVIDEHCPMHFVNLRKDDKFLERKMQLRIKGCECFIRDVEEATRISFSHPQCIRTFQCLWTRNIEIIRPLLNQVKPYVHCLTFRTDFDENIFSPPYVFPQVRKLSINGGDFIDVILAHQIPLLTRLHFRVYYREWQKMDETYTHFLNFLGHHAETMKHLELNISISNPEREQELFPLPNGLKRLLSKGRLQLQFLGVKFPYRYSSVWVPIIRSQKNLMNLNVELRGDHDKGGVTVHNILSAISSNILTLRSIELWDIPLFPSDDGTSLIPFDCSVFRDAVNLRVLRLDKNRYYVKGGEAEITNLGQIPLGSLKEFRIEGFVCNSGELQSLVDEAEVLENLTLASTIAPSNSPRFACTGVHGGIIQSFLDKPNKKRILVYECMNFSSQTENKKYKEIKLLYPNSHHKNDYFQAYF